MKTNSQTECSFHGDRLCVRVSVDAGVIMVTLRVRITLAALIVRLQSNFENKIGTVAVATGKQPRTETQNLPCIRAAIPKAPRLQTAKKVNDGICRFTR